MTSFLSLIFDANYLYQLVMKNLFSVRKTNDIYITSTEFGNDFNYPNQYMARNT